MGIHCKLSTILGVKRLKMADVVRGTGLARDTVRNLYYDKTRRVDYEVLEKICDYLDCSLEDLLEYKKDS
ncbi:MAG TPA: helix-turn-helix transcriptional regulator [Bacillota bacterium]|jgi:putative transcriptional regulator|nr:helix-turn-helix transcriptional regulator [Bacillota bacterium]HOL10413.1 helix-turn-helix transcriptional regulator [Bacillota bacterium]HPO96772.1 helix-turn-helix transcriptional regulator [Bacillota bacterium]